MTSQNPFLARVPGTTTPRRTLGILLAAAALLVFVAGTVWAARGVTIPTGFRSLLSGDATATPTRTPRPVTATPVVAPLNLAIVFPTATQQPTPLPAPTLFSPESAVPGWLAPVIERYGMDANRRFVVVDLATQQMVVWDPGRELRTMRVSTGDVTRGYRTLAWYGLVGDYWGTFNASGVYADEGWYLFEDSGHILIHGSPYTLVDGVKVYEEMDALGAYPASKGCIRLAPEDATWFTEWNPKGVPIVILGYDEAMGAG